MTASAPPADKPPLEAATDTAAQNRAHPPNMKEWRMNLFAGLRGRGTDTTLDVHTAVLVPAVAAMLADGRVEEEELFQLRSICVLSPIYERNSSLENELLIVRITRLIEDQDLQSVCERAATVLSPALRETAFSYAVKVIFSDGHVGRLEREAVGDMMSWLRIDPDRARMIIDVVSVMNHPATA